MLCRIRTYCMPVMKLLVGLLCCPSRYLRLPCVHMAVQSIGAGGPSAGLVATALCPMHGPVVQRSLSELLRQYRHAARMTLEIALLDINDGPAMQRSLSELLRQYRHAARMPCARPCFISREGHTSGALPDVQAAAPS